MYVTPVTDVCGPNTSKGGEMYQTYIQYITFRFGLKSIRILLYSTP
jgi:hypothetical protein